MFKPKLLNSVRAFVLGSVLFSVAQAQEARQKDELIELSPQEQRLLKNPERTPEKLDLLEEQSAKLDLHTSDITAGELNALGVGQFADGNSVGLKGPGSSKKCWAHVYPSEISNHDEDNSEDSTLDISSVSNLKKHADVQGVHYRFKGTEKVPTLKKCLELHPNDEKVDDLATLDNLKIDALSEDQVALTGVMDESGKVVLLKRFGKSDAYKTLEAALLVNSNNPECENCETKALKSVESLSGNKFAEAITKTLKKGMDKFKEKKYEEWMAQVKKHSDLISAAKNASDLSDVLDSLKKDQEDLLALDISEEHKKAGQSLLVKITKDNLMARRDQVDHFKGESVNASEYADLTLEALDFIKTASDDKTGSESEDHKRASALHDLYEKGQKDRLQYTREDAKAYSAWMQPIYTGSMAATSPSASTATPPLSPAVQARMNQMNALLDRTTPKPQTLQSGVLPENNYAFANAWNQGTPAAQVNYPQSTLFNVNSLPGSVPSTAGIPPAASGYRYPDFQQANYNQSPWGSPLHT